MLQQCSNELLDYDFNNIQLESREGKKCEPSNDKMVGTPSKGLESIKELILFDHIYHKQDDACPAQPLTSDTIIVGPEVIEVETSELNSDDFILPHNVIVQVQPATDMQNIPVIHIEEAESSPTPMPVHVLPGAAYEITFTEGKSLPSPTTSDAGYDSSFSALSPCSDACATNSDCIEERWDDSFTELFPSLV